MNCKQVLVTIDGLLFAKPTSAQFDAVERHARHCIGCRHAVAGARSLDVELGRLPEPAPSAGFAAAVMLRAAQIDAERSAVAQRAPHSEPTRLWSQWLAWTAVLVGVTVVLGAQIYGLLTGESTIGVTSLPLWGVTGTLIEMPTAIIGPTSVLLAAGLLLYLAGVFGSIRGAAVTGTDPHA